MSTKHLKRSLRNKLHSILHSLTNDNIQLQSNNVSKIIRSLPEYQNAKSIAIYASMEHGELNTDSIIKNAFLDGKSIYLPRIVPLSFFGTLPRFLTQKTELAMIKVPSFEHYESLLPHGKYQLREPSIPDSTNSSLIANNLDLIILPGVGFTKDCARLGHGKGYYDDYIIKIDDKADQEGYQKPSLVAVGLEEQLLSSIPVENHDRILDVVILNDKLFRKDQ